KLYATLEGVSEEQARFRPAEGAWSIGELAHHVALSQGRVLGALRRLLEQAERSGLGPDTDPATALSSLDFIVERAAQEKFKAPPQAVPEYGRALAATVPELRAQEAELEALLPRLAHRDPCRLKFPHPAFGDFDAYQWILFLGGHAARHARQMASVGQHPDWPKPTPAKDPA
ncbi:MAG: hypothetical protein DMG07_29320, partial [Acidobacteria bacterium]